MKTLIFLVIVLVVSISVAYADTEVKTEYGGLTGHRVAVFKTDTDSFSIWYKITNATVVSTPLDLPAKALIFFIKAIDDGQLVVQLPRSIIDSKIEDADKPFFVTVNQENKVSKANVTEIDDTYIRTLEINFTKNTSEVEIVGNLLAPKYPLPKPHYILPPLLQFRQGVPLQDIQCKSNFQLVFKSKDGSPACVSPESVFRLVSIGWARSVPYIVMHVEPKTTLNDYIYDGIQNEDNTTVSINNQTYYQTTLDYSVYNLPKDTPLQFHNVTFTFPEGTMATPVGAFVMLDIKFQDGMEEVYGTHTENEFGGIPVPTQYGPHQAVNSTTVLSNHVQPQAGMTILHDKIKLLVSTEKSFIS